MTAEREHEIGRCIFREANDAFFILNPQTLNFVDANPAAQRLTGLRKKQLQALTLTDLLECAPGMDMTALLSACRSSRHFTATDGYVLKSSAGTKIQVHVTASRIHLEQESLALLVVRDISKQKEAEEALRRSEDRFRKLAEKARLIPWEASAHPRQFTYVGPQAQTILGYPSERWYSPNFWADHLHPEDKAAALSAYEAGQAGWKDFELEYRMRSAMGQDVWLHDLVHVIPSGSGAGSFHGYLIDITERKRLEEELRQSQKMEAIGRLANGVAHDFNNLLTVISGYSGFLLAKIKHETAWRDSVEEIRKAAERGVSLTGQLLAFGRKQRLQPQLLNVNETLTNVQQLLRRLIGENIELSLLLDSNVGMVKFDPRQLELVVMNLALNAKDAMPKGGRLTLGARPLVLDELSAAMFRELRAGSYVLLTVSDTGHGMNESVRKRIFEPFFTTKELGRGTGLGLATVYGIIKQSGGHIEVTSQVEHGSTFSIYLPVSDEAPPRSSAAAAEKEIKGGTETVLLVEDEADLRQLARKILKQYGYTVLEAANGSSAVAAAQKHKGPIHLLLTDVVMPLMDGAELALELHQSRPDMRVLFMSGYAESSLPSLKEQDKEARLLTKPFLAETLARAVRAALDDKSPVS